LKLSDHPVALSQNLDTTMVERLKLYDHPVALSQIIDATMVEGVENI